jgi:hypothetical protein
MGLARVIVHGRQALEPALRNRAAFDKGASGVSPKVAAPRLWGCPGRSAHAEVRTVFRQTTSMGKETRPGSTEEIFASPVTNATAMRGALNRSLASSSLNPVAVGNQAIIAKKKRTILYKDGHTMTGKAAALLAAEALSGIEHSQKLVGICARRIPRHADPTKPTPITSSHRGHPEPTRRAT